MAQFVSVKESRNYTLYCRKSRHPGRSMARIGVLNEAIERRRNAEPGLRELMSSCPGMLQWGVAPSLATNATATVMVMVKVKEVANERCG